MEGTRSSKKGKAASSKGRLLLIFFLFGSPFYAVMCITQSLIYSSTSDLDIKGVIKEQYLRKSDSENSTHESSLTNAASAGAGLENANEEPEEEEGSSYLTMYGEHRVKEAIEHFPKWLSDYFSWHRSQTENASDDTKYLVVICTRSDRCGGFSDRLRSLPYMLFLASRAKRVICIHWSKPFQLEELLQPLASGIDWVCPSDFKPMVDDDYPAKKQTNFTHNLLQRHRRMISANRITEEILSEMEGNNDKFTSVGFKGQDFRKLNEANRLFHAYSYNDRMPLTGKWGHVPLLEHIFRAMFVPIEPIARNINATMASLGLIEKNYTSVHVRARYPTNKLRAILGKRESDGHDKGVKMIEFEGEYKTHLIKIAKNALQCGALLAPNNRMYFSSDSIDLTKYAIGGPFEFKDKGTVRTRHVVGIDSRNEIKHFEASHHGSNSSRVDFYPVLEDLLIMGGSQCVSHGIGSFGAFGAGLGGNICRNEHRSFEGNRNTCAEGPSDAFIENITDSDLMFGEKLTDTYDRRLGPAQGPYLADYKRNL